MILYKREYVCLTPFHLGARTRRIMLLFVVSLLFAVCACAPQFPVPAYRAPAPLFPAPAPGYYPARARAAIDRNAAILRADSQLNENGYSYAYETDNGIQAQESGVESGGTQAAGSFSYIGDDGLRYSVRYSAGAGGFRPEGAHLPTPPPLPPAIARSLQLNAQDEARGIFDDGSYRGAPAVGVRNLPNYRPGFY